MNKSKYQHLSRYRNNLNLKLKDVAYLLEIDTANLSRFEAGKTQNPKALLGYNILFGSSNGLSTFALIETTHKIMVHRCFRLLEILETKSKTAKNRLRMKGVNAIITRLTKDDE